MVVPTKIFFTKGTGVHRDRLASFELALRKAGIEKFNLVYVSSIFPPNCKQVSVDEGLRMLEPGEITHCVMAKNDTNEPNRLVSAAIGLALPKDTHEYGYLSEHHAFGETSEKTGEYAEDLAATMLATTFGIEFDINQAWQETGADLQGERKDLQDDPYRTVVPGRKERALDDSDCGSGLHRMKSALFLAVVSCGIFTERAPEPALKEKTIYNVF